MTRFLTIIICCTLLLSTQPSAKPQGKRVSLAFLQTWQSAADEPKMALSLWCKFAKQRPGDHDLTRLARLMAGIEMLRRADDPAQLRQVLPYFHFELSEKAGAPDTPAPPPLRKLIVRAGNALTARVQMLQLGRKLQKYYRKHVEYPLSLDELISGGFAEPADLTDPFGQRFVYLPKPRKLMPDLPRQTFTLRCLSIDAERRDLAKCLKRPAPITDILISSLTPQNNRAYIRRKRPDGAFGQSQAWNVGQPSGQLLLWAVYDNYLIAAWKQFPVVILKP